MNRLMHPARPLCALFTLLLLLALGACSTLVQPPVRAIDTGRPAGDAQARAVALDAAQAGYARVLQRHVNDQGEVDFAALRDDASSAGLPALETYVNTIAATPLDAAPTPDARLAHMINA